MQLFTPMPMLSSSFQSVAAKSAKVKTKFVNFRNSASVRKKWNRLYCTVNVQLKAMSDSPPTKFCRLLHPTGQTTLLIWKEAVAWYWLSHGFHYWGGSLNLTGKVCLVFNCGPPFFDRYYSVPPWSFLLTLFFSAYFKYCKVPNFWGFFCCFCG